MDARLGSARDGVCKGGSHLDLEEDGDVDEEARGGGDRHDKPEPVVKEEARDLGVAQELELAADPNQWEQQDRGEGGVVVKEQPFIFYQDKNFFS